ncbi:MAG: phosphopentomutase [Verrucomicrobia bacterium]|nr:phosphopentomutase [Verrucomicrobiota bacterium]
MQRPPGGKVLLLVLDGVGLGALPDAARYGDEGSHTLAHVAEAVGGLRLPNLASLGLGNIDPLRGVASVTEPRGCFGKAAQASRGKDSTTGHWEIAGLITEKEFPTYPRGFPAELVERFLQVTGCGGVLGNRAASGTSIMDELGAEHLRTGWPILYTSADSVFQIAAHEEVIPLERLYEICALARQQVCIGEHALSRVIARPFVGTPGQFSRTANRRDFSLAPSGPTLLDLLAGAGWPVVTVGKVDELFAGRGVSRAVHTKGNAEGVRRILELVATLDRGLVFANLVDFDTLYGHRNDAAGFARALEEFDAALPAILGALRAGDLLILTADHGNDPVTPSTDHSREYVPVLATRAGADGGKNLGTRPTYADIGKTVAEFFALENSLAGTSFLAMCPSARATSAP